MRTESRGSTSKGCMTPRWQRIPPGARATASIRLTVTPGFLDNGQMGSQLTDLTWTCMVCGAERPDAKISVLHVPIPGLEAQFPGTRTNVRYCNDRIDCMTDAE